MPWDQPAGVASGPAWSGEGLDLHIGMHGADRAGPLDPGAETVIINSGDGLKTLDAMADGAPAAGTSPAAPIRPTLAAFRAFEDSLAAADSP